MVRLMEMSSSLLFAIGMFLVCGLTSGRSISEPNNSLLSSGGDSNKLIAQDWVKITAAPAARVTHVPGATVELECEVSGSPPPTIHWIRGSSPLNLDWVKITAAPAARVTHVPGATVELECEVSGSPPPTIHWIRGSSPLNLR
uniref:Ig-like domain-containing protein n=1 Tax=Lutzomyia longipalpis TaxID=7200 RepID=A0A1B0C9W3_LUTLO